MAGTSSAPAPSTPPPPGPEPPQREAPSKSNSKKKKDKEGSKNYCGDQPDDMVEKGENTGPQIPLDPIALLTETHGIEEPFTSRYFGPGVFAAVFVTAVIGANYLTRRPVFSGIQKHVFAGVVGVYLGNLAQDRRNAYLAQKDAIYRHYIELHPEDFPILERKKYADVLETWYPVR